MHDQRRNEVLSGHLARFAQPKRLLDKGETEERGGRKTPRERKSNDQAQKRHDEIDRWACIQRIGAIQRPTRIALIGRCEKVDR
jgi:hypothetical protein